MENFVIQGGKKLRGSVRLGGAKNSSFKLMIASLLAKGETRLLNIPHIRDVEITREIISHLGARLKGQGERMLLIDSGPLDSWEIPLRYGQLSRASSMFIPPLLHRFGRAHIPLPGGDKIGARPLDRHFDGLRALGARIEIENHKAFVKADKLIGTRFKFRKNTHTGTETLIMAAVLAKGKTVIDNAAQEPEVDDLISHLEKMGARIKRIKKARIEIKGVSELKPGIHKVMPDRNEAVSYACAALATRGDIIVENANPALLGAFLEKVEEAGGGYEAGDFGIRFFYRKPLKSTKTTTQPHPGFMSDWQPLWAVVMTQAKGESIIHETVHNQRFQYTKHLEAMGAEVKFFNPKVSDPKYYYNFNLEDDRPEFFHAIKIMGPVQLKGTRLRVHDLRAGATLVLASLIAKGESKIEGIHHIDRGYENLEGRLIDLGASIKRV